MARSLGDDMQQNVAHGVQVRFTEQIAGPPGQCGVGRGSGDDGISQFRLPAIKVEYFTDRYVRGHPPRFVAARQAMNDLLVPGHDCAEPEPLHIERQVLDQPQAVPSGGQHGPSKILGVESVKDAEHVASLSVQDPKKRPQLTV